MPGRSAFTRASWLWAAHAIYSAAQTILDFKTEAARDIEAGRIKSIIDPRLADHVRREALKFADELNRAA